MKEDGRAVRWCTGADVASVVGLGMESTELYRRILGLEAPWRVVDVALDVKGNKVSVRVSDDGSARRCPECGKPGGARRHGVVAFP